MFRKEIKFEKLIEHDYLLELIHESYMNNKNWNSIILNRKKFYSFLKNEMKLNIEYFISLIHKIG